MSLENLYQIGVPLQQYLLKVLVKKKVEVIENESLFVIEAMKMEHRIQS